jgi:DnaK suppressor protein
LSQIATTCENSRSQICQDGNYGRGLECDEPIDERRLDVDPAAALCIECARNQ